MVIQSQVKDNKIQVVVDRETAEVFIDNYAVFSPGYKFDIKYQKGDWDGKIRFYKIHQIPDSPDFMFEFDFGFLESLKVYGVQGDNGSKFFDKPKVISFLSQEVKNLPFVPRKYQLKMVLGMLLGQRHLGIASTGSGKSLVSYLVIKYLLSIGKKVILIVPTISLVYQMNDDIKSYGGLGHNIQLLGGDFTDKNLKKPLVISTWQSLKNVQRKIIQEYDTLFVDEAHKAKADVLQDIMSTNVYQKIGMTGSFPIIELDAMMLEKVFGRPKRYATAKDLIDLGLLTKTTIMVMYLNYSRGKELSGIGISSTFKYRDEIKFLKESGVRKAFITKLINQVSQNGITVGTFSTLKYGESIYYSLTGVEMKGRFRNSFEQQKKLGVFYISGSSKPKFREQVREYLNSPESSNETLLAQTVTIDTGTNIPKMKNFIFLEMPGKSFTKILQSIGRVMRKSEETGDSVFVFDLVDSFGYSTENYSLQHFWERLKYYESERHEIIEKEYQLGLR